MKKIFVAGLCLAPMLALFGCGQTDCQTLVRENMSEKSDVYYFSDNADFLVSVCSGQREEKYAYDGKSDKKVDFALVIAELSQAQDEMVKVTINGVESDLILEYNYRTGKHMADLERKLSDEEEISITYMDKTASLKCKSKDFKVSADQAIELGMKNLEEFISPLCQGKNFKGECYLKIMDGLSGGTSEPLWLFSVLDEKGEMKNVIISTNEPIVLADGKQNML